MNIFSRSAAKRRVQVKTCIVTCAAIAGLSAAGVLTKATVDHFKPAAPQDFYGEAVKLDDKGQFDVRRDCRIGRFGVAPWRKSGELRDSRWVANTHRALMESGMPEAAVLLVMIKMQSGKSDDTIFMGDTFGQADTSKQYFLPRYTTTYRVDKRHTVCTDSGTRFNNDRQEPSTLHVIPWGDTTYYVGEFTACGNVTRFFPAPPGWLPPHLAPYPLPDGQSPHGGGSAPVVNEVPEPSSWALIGMALAAMVLITRKRRKS